MTVSIGLVLVSLLLPLGIGAFPSEGVQFVGEAGLNYVKVPIQAVTPVFEHSSHLKRQAKLRTWSWMNNASYSVRVRIGSNEQPVQLALDVEQGITWVNPDCHSGNTALEMQNCMRLPVYNPRLSHTSIEQETALRMTYEGTGIEIKVGFFTDNFKIGNKSIRTQRFGVATESIGQQQGVLALGPLEPHMNWGNIQQNLARQYQIKSAAFSLDLRNFNEESALIFGGIDSKKYKCDLEKLAMVKSPDSQPRYLVSLTGFSQTLDGKKKDYPSKDWLPTQWTSASGIPVDFDTTSTFTVLPPPLVKAIVQDYPEAKWDNLTSTYTVPCTPPKGSLDFTFGRKTVSIRYEDLLWQRPRTEQCVLGIKEGTEIIWDLGGSFLRGAYVVIDQDNNNVWMDEADDCGSNVVEIGEGPDSVPKIKGCKCAS